MIEGDKQKMDQNDKPAKNEQHEHKQKKQPETKAQPKQAQSDTDPAAANDKQYIERMEEKTEKH